jgi:hypothetical protein
VRNAHDTQKFVEVDTSALPVVLDRVRVFYNWFGAYPTISADTSRADRIRFGRIPQRVVENDSLWDLHQRRIRRFLDRPTPTIGIDTAWTGYAVIDYEYWSPLWSHTPQRYRNASIERERSRAPNAPADTIRTRARRNYETAARTFLVRTLEYANQLRPNAKWGYYGYPHPGRVRSKEDRASKQATNDRLQWLYDASEVIYPSIYMMRKSTSGVAESGESPVEENCDYVRYTLEEAARISRGKPVVPFTWHLYHNSNPEYAGTLLSGYDLEFQYVYPAYFQVDAVILWGDAQPDDDAMRTHFQTRIAPLMEYVHYLHSWPPPVDHRLYAPAPCWSSR